MAQFRCGSGALAAAAPGGEVPPSFFPVSRRHAEEFDSDDTDEDSEHEYTDEE